MDNFSEITQALRGELDGANAAREAALPRGREIIRLAANTIRAAHRGEFEAAQALLDTARARVDETRTRFAGAHPAIFYAGYVQDAHKEYAEAALVVAILQNAETPGTGVWPTPADLRVTAPVYLNGLGEAMGECRRYALDLLRRDEGRRADAVLSVMDGVYEALVTFDYPDAVTGGLRRTTDLVRGVLERTRADVALTVAQGRLREEIQRLQGTIASPTTSNQM